MKKIFNILLLGVFALPMFTACETDDESNPILNEPTSFVLNVPPYAVNNVYDLKNGKSVELTCSQPDYGFPASTTYTVQISLDSEFTEETSDAKANYASLETLYSTAKMEVVASDMNAALLELWSVKNEGQPLPSEPVGIFVRLKAFITGSNKGVCLSNVIGMNVLGTNEKTLELPENMLLVGSMLNNWSVWKPMAKASGLNGQFWALVYFEENAEFKFGTKENEYIGGDDTRVKLEDKANSGLTAASNGNILVPTAGWYTVYIKVAVKGSEYGFDIMFYPGEVYLFGETNGGVWEYNENWKFTIPTQADGDFVSPATIATGEARLCVKTDIDWWRTEFTLHNGTIFYRENNNIGTSWSSDMGAEYSVQPVVGNVILLNFTTGTGKLQ
ncbi:SusF/SusE family outer membrane protein [Bacteroides reticulotermitis]|uniref:SusF/SusE family outer membrane protein n=1 Tax=Bacteroides reticulotermitis TaxID=1133319 RepID=UPI003A87D2D2